MKIQVSGLPAVIMAALEAGIPLCIWGDSGIGKTAISTQVAKEYYDLCINKKSYTYFNDNEIRTKILDLPELKPSFFFENLKVAHCESEDWGIPHKEESPSGYLYHTYTRPQWCPAPNFLGLFTLLLDEVNRGDDRAINSILEMLGEGMLRGQHIPQWSRFIMTANPPAGGFKGTKVMDKALLNRAAHVHVVSNPRQLLAIRGQQLDMMSGVLASKANFHVGDPESVGDIDSFDVLSMVDGVPRLLEQANKLAHYYSWLRKKDLEMFAQNEQSYLALLAGLIGLEDAKSWMELFKENKNLTLDKILSGEVPVEKLPDFPDDQLRYITYFFSTRISDSLVAGNPEVTQEHLSKPEVVARFKRALGFYNYIAQESAEKCGASQATLRINAIFKNNQKETKYVQKIFFSEKSAFPQEIKKVLEKVINL